jgi:hypothetical protein
MGPRCGRRDEETQAREKLGAAGRDRHGMRPSRGAVTSNRLASPRSREPEYNLLDAKTPRHTAACSRNCLLKLCVDDIQALAEGDHCMKSC